MGKKSKSKTRREMQDNTAAVEEEKPSSSAKKLLNHWLRFSSASPCSPKTNITLNSEFDGILLDYSRQCATPETLEIGRAASLKEKINRMFGGERVRFKFIFLWPSIIEKCFLFFLKKLFSDLGEGIKIWDLFQQSRENYHLANVDPIDVSRNIAGLNPETTLGKH
ncbi:unnamed protein product [Prunus brigantina]